MPPAPGACFGGRTGDGIGALPEEIEQEVNGVGEVDGGIAVDVPVDGDARPFAVSVSTGRNGRDKPRQRYRDNREERNAELPHDSHLPPETYRRVG